MNAPEHISISSLLNERAILLDLKEPHKNTLLHELCTKLAEVYHDIPADTFYEHILDRENDLSTGIGNHIAIPHALMDNLQEIHLLFATHVGLNYDALDNKTVKIIFLLAIPIDRKELYGKLLMQISTYLRQKEFRDSLLQAKEPTAIIDIFTAIEQADRGVA